MATVVHSNMSWSCYSNFDQVSYPSHPSVRHMMLFREHSEHGTSLTTAPISVKCSARACYKRELESSFSPQNQWRANDSILWSSRVSGSVLELEWRVHFVCVYTQAWTMSCWIQSQFLRWEAFHAWWNRWCVRRWIQCLVTNLQRNSCDRGLETYAARRSEVSWARKPLSGSIEEVGRTWALSYSHCSSIEVPETSRHSTYYSVSFYLMDPSSLLIVIVIVITIVIIVSTTITDGRATAAAECIFC